MTATNDTNKKKTLKWMNFGFYGALTFILVYSFVLFLLLNARTEEQIQDALPPIVYLNNSNLSAIVPPGANNLIHPMFITTNNVTSTNTSTDQVITNQTKPPCIEYPSFVIKEKYKRGDFVIINYFYIKCIVMKVLPDDVYVVVYKDHNHVLQRTEIHRDFLISPTPGAVNPFSLLVD